MIKNTILVVALMALGGSLWAATEMAVETGSPTAPAKTTILSETLEMVSGAKENVFYFSNNVRVAGNNLKMTSEKMVVTATRADSDITPAKGKVATNAQVGTIQKIVATGNVRITQEAREAIAGRAEFFPKEGKVVLTENPRVVDSKAIVSGWRITLYQGERRVMVEQNPEGTTRPTVNLESLPNLGFDPKKETPTEPELAPVSAGVAPVAPPIASPVNPAVAK